MQTYTTTLTSKGQMTMPAAFRKMMGVKPGEKVRVTFKAGKTIVEKDNWLADLRKTQARNRDYMKKNGIKPLNDQELDDAINAAAEAAATERYRRSLPRS